MDGWIIPWYSLTRLTELLIIRWASAMRCVTTRILL